MRRSIAFWLVIGFTLLIALNVSAQGETPTAIPTLPPLLIPNPEIEVLGSGKVGTIDYGETVSGHLDFTPDMPYDLPAIYFVGHNGAGRKQGDFDAWYFDAPANTSTVITVTATDGDLIPELLIAAEPPPEQRVVAVAALDLNVDQDAHAGLCIRSWQQDWHYVILVERQEGTEQTGSYQLTLERADSDQDLSYQTAACRVGTWAISRGDSRINIRVGESLSFRVKGVMQPGQPYTVMSADSVWFGSDDRWVHIRYRDADRWSDGYVSQPLVRIVDSTAITDADSADS